MKRNLPPVLGVSGSRTITDYDAVAQFLDRCAEVWGKPMLLIHGGAEGFDKLAEQWAKDNGVETKCYRPKWRGRCGRCEGEGYRTIADREVMCQECGGQGTKFFPAAGFMRNNSIVNDSTHFAAMWDGKSGGTKQAITTARRKELPVRVYTTNRRRLFKMEYSLKAPKGELVAWRMKYDPKTRTSKRTKIVQNL